MMYLIDKMLNRLGMNSKRMKFTTKEIIGLPPQSTWPVKSRVFFFFIKRACLGLHYSLYKARVTTKMQWIFKMTKIILFGAYVNSTVRWTRKDLNNYKSWNLMENKIFLRHVLIQRLSEVYPLFPVLSWNGGYPWKKNPVKNKFANIIWKRVVFRYLIGIRPWNVFQNTCLSES